MGIGAVGAPGWRDPDGAGQVGPEQHVPEQADTPFEHVLNGLNPMHHIPVVGMLYRMATGEQIPAIMRVVGAGIVGGPMGALGAGLMGMLEHVLTLPPDQTRPGLAAGMAGNDGGVQPPEGEGYVTLATTVPDWLDARAAARGAAYAASGEWDRAQAWERGAWERGMA